MPRAKKQKGAESLADAKGGSFGSTLRDAIVEEHGTNEEFRKALGVSLSQITHFVKGEHDVTPRSLGKILAGFKSLPLQERVYAAWLREFAPGPVSEAEDTTSEELLIQIANVGRDLSPRRALKLAVAQRRIEVDPKLKQKLTERIIQLYLRLEQSAPALKAVMALEKQSRLRNDPDAILTALWMRGNVLRNIDGVPAEVLLASHEAARGFAEAVKPTHGDALVQWRNQNALMDRDFALHVIKASYSRPLSPHLLDLALQAVQRSIDADIDDEFRYTGLEVRARVELALGRIDDAEETLDEVEEKGVVLGIDLREKTGLARARVLAKKKETDEAMDRLKVIARRCLEENNVHHAIVADRELVRILLKQ